MKKLNLTLLFLGSVFLAYLVYRLGPGHLWQQIRALGWGIGLLILVEGAANLAHTVGWRHCMPARENQMPLLRLFCLVSTGYAINYLTPTASVGGDVCRAALLARTHKGPEAATSVLLDKLMTAVAHLMLVVLGAVYLSWQVRLPVGLWLAMAATTLLFSGGMGVFVWLQKHGKLGGLCRWLVEHRLGGRSLQKLAQQVTEVDETLKTFYRERPRDLALSVGWHLIGHSAAILHAWLFLCLLKQPAPLTTVAAAGFLSLWFDLLTFAIPLNLGTLEGTRIVIFKALGCEALLGITFALAIRLAQVSWAGFGLASYAVLADLHGLKEAPVQCRPPVACQDI